MKFRGMPPLKEKRGLADPLPMSHLTDVEIASILSFSEAGWPTRAIGQKLHRSQSVVSRTLRNYEFESFIERKPRPKPPHKTSIRGDRLLLRIAKQNSSLPLHDITNISEFPISDRTLSRRLQEVELYSRVKRHKPYLSDENMKARLHWAIMHKDWSLEQWKKVIWSDETLIKLDGHGRREQCIRKKGEAYKKENCVPTFQSGRISLMVWACFTGEKLGPLLVCDAGSVDGEAYSEILFDGLLSFVDDLFDVPDDATIRVATANTLLFMHDNAPCHKSNDVRELLEEAHIPVMEWPAQSPDLNPIENLWPHVKREFRKRFFGAGYHPSRSPECRLICEKLLQEVWQSMGLDLICRLIESMSERCDAVIAAGGGPTRF